MQKLALELTIEDVNLVLEGLGSLPYAKVYNAIAAIQQQAQQQLQNSDNSSQIETNGVETTKNSAEKTAMSGKKQP